MQNILTLETNKYSIKLNNFEGPLDLLCHLIDKNKMDIYDINLSEITDQLRSNNLIFSNVINTSLFKVKTFIAKVR